VLCVVCCVLCVVCCVLCIVYCILGVVAWPYHAAQGVHSTPLRRRTTNMWLTIYQCGNGTRVPRVERSSETSAREIIKIGKSWRPWYKKRSQTTRHGRGRTTPDPWLEARPPKHAPPLGTTLRHGRSTNARDSIYLFAFYLSIYLSISVLSIYLSIYLSAFFSSIDLLGFYLLIYLLAFYLLSIH